MNLDDLHELINRYEAKIDKLYGTDHYELFKWRATRCWQDNWNRPEEDFSSFAERFNASRKEFGWFMDNSRMHPSTGVIKLWEKEPETVEKLFHEVLFADDSGNLAKRQDHMDAVVEGFELLRGRYFPGNWSYKHDRHSASVLLAVNAPEENYVFKSNNALKMAQYTDFGLRIGSGQTFSLENYYKMCDGIREALKEHPSLLEKHFAALDETHYMDKSLHLLTFDLIYCCYCYNYYHDLVAPVTGRTIRRKTVTVSAPSPEEMAQIEAERQLQMAELEGKIETLEQSLDSFEEIPLLGVQVTTVKYGTGVVVWQDADAIKVRFENEEKKYFLDEKYTARPRFEDDDLIISAYTQYARDREELAKLRKQLVKLQKE